MYRNGRQDVILRKQVRTGHEYDVTKDTCKDNTELLLKREKRGKYTIKRQV